MASSPVLESEAPARVPVRTLADLVEDLGSIPLSRILLTPAPGTATEADLLAFPDDEGICELVDGTLVMKAMGFYESLLASVLIGILDPFARAHDLGIVVGPDALVRLAPGLNRAPDVSFVAWERLPGGEVPGEPVPDLAPDLAIEVLRRSNTRREIARKLDEYFAACTRLAWIMDPRARTVRVHRSPTEWVVLTEADELDGGDVLPGFRLLVREWFDRSHRRPGTR